MQTWTPFCGCVLTQDPKDLDNCVEFAPCRIHQNIKKEEAVRILRQWAHDNPDYNQPPENPNRFPFIVDASQHCIINSKEDIKDCLNELRTIEKLQNGLFTLYSQVRRLEIEHIEKSLKTSAKSIVIGYDPREEKSIEQILLTNYFHWFANDLINYVRLVGFTQLKLSGEITREDILFNGNRDQSKVVKLVKEYITSIEEIKNVEHWRNKVSADFAITDPRKNEDLSTRLESLLQDPSFWISGRYSVGVLKIGDSTENYQWSLTEVFDQLSLRYWPEGHDFFQQRFNGFQIESLMP